MLSWLGKILRRVGTWLTTKSIPFSLTGTQWSGSAAFDSYRRHRNPTPNELLQELKATAWTCISINAQACASYSPNLYVVTKHNTPRPKCPTRPLSQKSFKHLHRQPHLRPYLKAAEIIEEVTDHPLLELLQNPTAPLNILGSWDLWELTTLYQEVHGCAYWYLDLDPMLGLPTNIWILPSQNVTPKRNPNSTNVVDYYRYRTGTSQTDFAPNQIIQFRYPDPRDPYTNGISPLRAIYEQQALSSEYYAFRRAKFDNHAIPDAIISPAEVIGEEERDRLQIQWEQRMRRGGAGHAMIAESPINVQLLNYSMGDLAALADMGANKETIMNAFHVPVAFFTSSTNLANLMASNMQHADQAIAPRIQRRDQKLNETLVPLFDPTGRLFLASDDPIPSDAEATLAQQAQDLQYGVLSINEMRSGRGLPPVGWGHVPWLSSRMMPTDQPRPGTTGPSADLGTTSSDDELDD